MQSCDLPYLPHVQVLEASSNSVHLGFGFAPESTIMSNVTSAGRRLQQRRLQEDLVSPLAFHVSLCGATRPSGSHRGLACASRSEASTAGAGLKVRHTSQLLTQLSVTVHLEASHGRKGAAPGQMVQQCADAVCGSWRRQPRAQTTWIISTHGLDLHPGWLQCPNACQPLGSRMLHG